MAAGCAAPGLSSKSSDQLTAESPSERNGYAKKHFLLFPSCCPPVVGSCRLQQRRGWCEQHWHPRVRGLAAAQLGPGQLESDELAVNSRGAPSGSRRAS